MVAFDKPNISWAHRHQDGAVGERIALQCGGEVHRSVREFQPKTWLFEARDGMLEKMRRQ